MRKYKIVSIFLVFMLTFLIVNVIYANSNLPVVVVNDINENITKITPTPSPIPTPSPTPTPSPSPSPTPTVTPTQTPSPTPTHTITPTPTPTKTPTITPKPIPKTGDNYFIIVLIVLMSVASILFIIKYKH